jgi:streptogramin lyase
MRSKLGRAALVAVGIASSITGATAAMTAPDHPPRSINELKRVAIIHVGKTADWVAISTDAVWVGSTGPNAVHRVDPKTNAVVATVAVPGSPCAGLATGFGSLWVPLCGETQTLAKVSLESNQLVAVYRVGTTEEGGVTTSPEGVWLMVDKRGTLARIDPDTGAIRQRIRIAPGSYNPRYADGQIWVTRADGAEVTAIDTARGVALTSTRTNANPRFLTASPGAVWTLNQGDGSVTRIDTQTRQATKTIDLGTPGHGGDIAFGGGMIWTTVAKMPLSVVDVASEVLLCQWAGPGGDSLGIGQGSIWLTDYQGGTISRIDMQDALTRCPSAPATSPGKVPPE